MELSNALVPIFLSFFCLALLGWIFISRLRVEKHLSHAPSGDQNADRRLEQFARKLLLADADQAESFDAPSASKTG